jgi:hypothetical protein
MFEDPPPTDDTPTGPPVALVRQIPNEPDLDQPPPLEPLVATNGHRNGHRPSPTTAPETLPPHDLEAERNLLGAILVGGHHAIAQVDDDAFYNPNHQHIATALRDLITGGHLVDTITLEDQLRTRGALDQIGGLPAIADILKDAPSPAAAEPYADIVNRHWRARQLDQTGRTLSLVARRDGPDAAYELLQAAQQHHLPTGTVGWEDVAGVLTGDYEPMRPSMLERSDGQHLVYPGLLHWIMGEPGKGKTWVALHLAAEQLQAGHHVIYLDWEGNRQIVGERLAALGCTVEDLERFHYLRPPRISRNLADQIAQKARDTTCTVAICDGVAKALARQDLNEDKAADVLAWLELVTHPLTEAGAAVVCLDHVTKDKDTRGLWPRGSGAKQGEVSGAAWVVKPKVAFSRHDAGEISLIQAKDREGHVGLDGDVVARILLAPHEGGKRLDIKVATPAAQGTEFRPTALMARISLALDAMTQQGETPTGTALLKEVPGQRAAKLVALQKLIEEAYVTTQPGPRNATLHTSIRLYTELDDPHSDRYRPADEPPPEETRWDDF